MGLGKTYSTKYLLDSNNSSGVAGQVLSTTSTGIDWADANTLPGAGLWLENGNDIYNDNSGKVFINASASIPNRTEEFQVTGTQIITNTGTSSPALYLGYNSSGSNSVQLGRGRTADGSSYIDLNGEVMAAGDYGFRIRRRAGVNAITDLIQVGTGSLTINALNGADTVFTNTNVGIGTISPLRKLHVGGNFAVNAGTGEYYGVNITGGEGANPNILIGDWHNSSANIKWDSSGNYLRIDAQHSTSGAPIVFSGNDSAIEYMRIASSGNVGIGTTNPAQNFVVADATNGNGVELVPGATGTIQTYNRGTSTYTNLNIDTLETRVRSIGATVFNNGSGFSERMRITSAGNVGIGVTTTNYKLEVGGTSKISGNVIIGTDPNTYANLTLKDATTASANSKSLFIWSQNSGRSFLSLVTAGTGEAQIGFGTSQYASQNTSGSIQYTQATSKFTFKTNYTLALTIANNQAATFTSTVTATNFILSSDKTLKNNIKEIDTNHIDVNWKNFELKSEPGVKRAGVIAQELEEVHPEFVRTDDQGMKSVAYIDLLITKIAELEARLEKLEK